MARSSPFALIAFAFAGGVWLASQFAPALWLSGLILIPSVLAAIITRHDHEQKWASAMVAIVAAGSLYYPLRLPENTTAPYNGHTVVLEGVVDEEPDARPELTYLRVRVQRLWVGSSSEYPDGIVLVRTDNAIRWRYGDVLRAWGTLDAPPVLSEFDYRDYLARRGVFSWLTFITRIQRTGEGWGSPLYAALLQVKDALRHSAQAIMPSPESALLNGILIGDDNEMPDSVKTAFQRTGTSHIVAISGFNVSIVVALIVPLLSRWFGKRRAAAVALPTIALYTLLTGASSSVVRAALMAGIVLFGQLLWRHSLTLNTLCAAAFFMLVGDPQVLFDMSFQLSVMATLGLVLYSGTFSGFIDRALLSRLHSEQSQKLIGSGVDLVAPTLTASLTTLPLMLSVFKMYSLVSLVTNTLVLPLQTLVMTLGIAACLAGLVSVPAGAVLGLPAYALLTATLRIVEGTSQPAWAAMPVYSFDSSYAVIYYLALVSLSALVTAPASLRQNVASFVRKRLRRGTVFLLAAAAVVVGLVFWYQRPDGRLHVTFVGSGAFIQTPAGNQVVFAGGGGVLPVMGRAMPLWDRGVELLVMPARDDLARGDTLPLLQRYRVGTLILPGAQDEPSAMLDEWNSQATNSGAHVVSVPIGTRAVVEPGVVLTVEQRAGGLIGARLAYGSSVFDLAGNTSAISGTLAGADVVFASVKRNEPDVLNAARPRYVVWADAGGAPVRLAAGIQTFILRDVEAVEFISDGKTVTVRQ